MRIIKNCLICVLVLLTLILVACTTGENPISVSILDITSPGNTNITFSVKYQEEESYKDKSTDILVKADENNITFKIKKELEDFVEITLPQKNIYYSLTKLMEGEEFRYKSYKDAVNKNYIINSNQDFILTLKAVVGDVSDYKTMLLKSHDVSKEYKLIVKKYEK